MTPPKKESETGAPGVDDDPLGFKQSGAEALKRVEQELEESERRDVPARATDQSRTTPIAVRFDQFTIKRLRSLAGRRNIGYQTLLKQFVIERLYEEERREGIIE